MPGSPGSLSFYRGLFPRAESAKHVLGDTQSAEAAWELPRKRFDAKQKGLRSVLISKLQLGLWDDTGTIHSTSTSS